MTSNYWIVTIDDPIYYGPMYTHLINNTDTCLGIISVNTPWEKSYKVYLQEIKYRLRFWGFTSFMKYVFLFFITRIKSNHNITKIAKNKLIPIYHVNDISSLESLINTSNCDLVICTVMYKIPERLLKIPNHGWLNIHCGPLPRYAGLDAPFWCLLNDEVKCAVTIHAMDNKYDSGNMKGF